MCQFTTIKLQKVNITNKRNENFNECHVFKVVSTNFILNLRLKRCALRFL